MKLRPWITALAMAGMMSATIGPAAVAQGLPASPGGQAGGQGGGDRGGQNHGDGHRGPGNDGGGPPDGGGPDGGGPGGGGPGGGGPGGGGPGGGPDGQMGGPGGDQNGPPPPPPPRGGPRSSVAAMREYIDLVDRYTTLASNSSAAGISAVVSLVDIMKPKGAEPTIAKLNELLAQATDPNIQRAVRLQLIDLYKVSKQDDKAIEQIEILVKAAPSATAQPSSDATPAPGH